eukprot:12943407-Alexandrium_andersonii.AAC.1
MRPNRTVESAPRSCSPFCPSRRPRSDGDPPAAEEAFRGERCPGCGGAAGGQTMRRQGGRQRGAALPPGSITPSGGGQTPGCARLEGALAH